MPKSTTKENLRQYIRKYLRGEETMGVVSSYEVAAIKNGVLSITEIEELWKEERRNKENES